VGLGLPLLDMVAQQCGGQLTIQSELHKGTVVTVCFPHDHIDRPPLGNIKSTMLTLVIGNPQINFCFSYRYEDREFGFCSKDITDLLDGISLSHPLVFEWLDGFIAEGMQEIFGGVMYENS